MKYIEKFPPVTVEEEAIKLKLDKYLSENKDPFSEYISERDKYQRKLMYLIVATLTVFSLPILLAFLFNDQNLIWLIFVTAPFIVFLNDIYIKYNITKKDLVFEINYVCFSAAFKVFDIPVRKTIIFYGHIKEIISESLLYTGRFKQVTNNDTVRFNIDGKECNISEISIGHFKGWLVSCDLNKKLGGRTFISTEGDKYGFGHITFWNRVLQSSDVQETELEWNQFEKKLHVASNNPVEARDILVPDFMSQLYDWWNEQSEQNIRISFYDNKMSMLFADPTVDFTLATLKESVSTEDLLTHTKSIAHPSRHMLNLICDVLRRVR